MIELIAAVFIASGKALPPPEDDFKEALATWSRDVCKNNSRLSEAQAAACKFIRDGKKDKVVFATPAHQPLLADNLTRLGYLKVFTDSRKKVCVEYNDVSVFCHKHF